MFVWHFLCIAEADFMCTCDAVGQFVSVLSYTVYATTAIVRIGAGGQYHSASVAESNHGEPTSVFDWRTSPNIG